MNLTVNEILNTPIDVKAKFFSDTLLSTHRRGIENVLSYLSTTDFYRAPSSTKYHSNYDGGLLDHSLLVYATAQKLKDDISELRPEIVPFLTDDVLIITTLLHDVCKANFYKKTNSWKKDEQGKWKEVQSYIVEDSLPLGHGEKSLAILLSCGLDLKPEEMLAIRWHMGNWEACQMSAESQAAYRKSMNEVFLVGLLCNADTISSNLLESIYTY